VDERFIQIFDEFSLRESLRAKAELIRFPLQATDDLGAHGNLLKG
jgi:hypothetical protein